MSIRNYYSSFKNINSDNNQSYENYNISDLDMNNNNYNNLNKEYRIKFILIGYASTSKNV